MKISDLMPNDSILLSVKAKNKRNLLQELAEFAASVTKISDRTIFDTILERENLGSTGFGGGVALPHGRLAELDRVYVFCAKLSTPIDFESIDNKPVDVVFLLLSPESSGADHLTALAQVSRILKNNGLINKIREAQSTEEIHALLNN
ncbi:MAG: PTS sugar transporter subunit IIA [Alphaproteobacteria bacterium]|nr:PTS sugar transporter subunit IIA [Alphaproteobacteria bacterium]